jgi:hypothetical protein
VERKRNGAPQTRDIPGDNTYANYQEANRTFWRQTVLPLVSRTAKALSGWLSPAWGGGLSLRPDLDAIDALSSEREALWARLDKATFLTRDEKRAAVDYAPLGPPSPRASGERVGVRGSHALKYHPDQPRVPAGQRGAANGRAAGAARARAKAVRGTGLATRIPAMTTRRTRTKTLSSPPGEAACLGRAGSSQFDNSCPSTARATSTASFHCSLRTLRLATCLI